MLSGYLFFVKGNSKGRLKKYLYRLLRLYVCWSIAYLPFDIYYIWNRDVDIDIYYFIEYMKKGLFDGFYYHLWYIPSLMAAILLIYICDRYMKDCCAFIIAVILFICGTIVDNYAITGEWIHRIIVSYKNIFLTTRNGLFFGFIFVLLGKILAEQKIIISRIASDKFILFLLIIALLIQLLEAENLRMLYGDGRANNMLLSTIFSSVLLFLLFYNMKICRCLDSNSEKLRNISTIIYFIHPAVILILRKILNMISVPISIGLVIMLFTTIIVAILYVLLAERFEFLRKMY